ARLGGVRGPAPPPPARATGAGAAVGFFLDPRLTGSFRAGNRLLAGGEEVRRLREPCGPNGAPHSAGTFYVVRKPTTLPLLDRLAFELGTPFAGCPVAPGAQTVALKPVRVGLWDRHGGSSPSGWARWLPERVEVPSGVVYPPELDRGGLREKFDVLIFVDGAISGGGAAAAGRRPGGDDAGGDQPPPDREGMVAVNEQSLTAEY